MAVCARVKWLERAACESGAHHPPRREHAPPPALACMGGGGGGCVGAVDAMGCVALAMAIVQLYDAAAGSRAGPIARTDRRGPTRRACHSPTEPGANGDGVACTQRAMSAGGGRRLGGAPPTRRGRRCGPRYSQARAARVRPPPTTWHGGTRGPAGKPRLAELLLLDSKSVTSKRC